MTSPFLERNEQEIFSDLEALCSSSGFVHVLAFLSVRDNMVSFEGRMTSKDMADSYVTNRTARTEFSTLLGLMVKYPVDFSFPPPDVIKTLIERTQALLIELHKCLERPMRDALLESIKRRKAGSPFGEVAIFTRGDVLREPIFYGGDSAYSFQYLDFALQRYAEDNLWLRSNKGFGIEEAGAVIQALSRLTQHKVTEIFENAKSFSPLELKFLSGFTFTPEEIASETGLAIVTVELVLVAFTTATPAANADFKSLGDFNICNAAPIFRSPDDFYISFEGYKFREALYDSPFYWLMSDKKYKNMASANRGIFTENFTARRLTKVFSPSNVHLNVDIMRKGTKITEVDVLVLFADRAIVIQCKSKKLTLEARKGNDQKIRDDFKKSIQESYDQAYICAISLSDPDLEFIAKKGKNIKIPALRHIYPLCVVSDHYPALAVQAREFLKYQTNDTIRHPFVADIFLIDVLAEMLENPLYFLNYLDRRALYGNRIMSTNELAILGYHLRQNIWIDADINMMLIDESSSLDLDTAMTVRREGLQGIRTPEGVLTRLEGSPLEKIVDAIKYSSNDALIDFGFVLLTLSGETLDKLWVGLEQIIRKARQDGLTHDLTLGFEDSSAGLTVYCEKSPTSATGDQLARHCECRKYRHQAETWFGLAIRSSDGLPVFGLKLHFPWERDDGLDAATRNMPLLDRPPDVKASSSSRKVGRNFPCPCGSGKKFKKCCIS
jgi:hypothetical protein